MLLFCKFKTTFYCKFSSFFWMTFTNLHLCYYRIPPLWSYRYARLCILSSSLQMKESTLSWSWNCVLGSTIFGWRLLPIYIYILTLFSKSLTSSSIKLLSIYFYGTDINILFLAENVFVGPMAIKGYI